MVSQSMSIDNGKMSSSNGTTTAAQHDTTTVQVRPIADGPRRRRHSRLMSNASVMSAAAAGVRLDDKHKISNVESIVHMIKATIGGGFLAMPEAFRHAGVVVGLVGTLLIGLTVLNMMAVIVRFSQALRSGKYAAAILAERNPKNSANEKDQDAENVGKYPLTQRNSKELLLPPMDYPETVATVFQRGARGRFAHWGPFFRKLTSTSLVGTYYGVNVIYVCIVANTFKQIVDQYTADGAENTWAYSVHNLSIRWYPTITALLIVPVGMVRLMKYLVPFSLAANACLVAGTCAIFYFIFNGEDGEQPMRPEDHAKLLVWPINRWTLFMGNTLCSMEGVGMLLHIENAMRRPKELAGPPSYTLHWSMIAIILLNGMLGLFGYLRYGDLSKGSISLNIPTGNRLSDVVKLMVSLGILLTYGLQLTVTADLAWQWLRPKLVNTVAETDSTAENDIESSPRLNMYYYCMRFSLILGTILVATAVPDIGPLVSLVGGVGFSILGLIVPVIMEVVWYWYPSEDGGDDDDNDYEECWDDVVAVAAKNVNGDAVATVVEGTSSTNDYNNIKSINHRRVFYRILRYFKAAGILLFGGIALIGGGYYNIREIMNLAYGRSSEPE